MRLTIIILNLSSLFLILSCFICTQSTALFARRRLRHALGNGVKDVNLPMLGDEIDLGTIDGIEQVTRLILMKTDSLPSNADNKIDERYLNGLTDTLYTGLRKPFKSVSADILGIFPSFEEIQIRCERNYENRNIEKENISSRSRRALDNQIESRNETMEVDYVERSSHKSALQVCKAVTNECLSMEDLVQILPSSVRTFDTALVRLCPVVLFRIMNHICHKPSDQFDERRDDVVTSSAASDSVDEARINTNNKMSNPNGRLRDNQMMMKIQSSEDLAGKRPQRLHKKLKTHTPYKNNGRLNSGNLEIRLKLSEPSIEKVWIFSLLFVILSIVVSMGGLIVLPFVRKTTRRRILTLFEGLAVGGLSGSATLHMFPQAFGLVDENYHKYFWRIFVVFLGIYVCYLCERIIKILKVVRAKVRRRSIASLVDMDLYYGFPSINSEVYRQKSTRHNRLANMNDELHAFSAPVKMKKSKRRLNDDIVISLDEPIQALHKPKKTSSKIGKTKLRALNKSKTWLKSSSGSQAESVNELRVDPNLAYEDSERTRQRLVHCLKSVQEQFSPGYAVRTQVYEGAAQVVDEPRAGRLMRSTYYYDAKRTKRFKLPTMRSKDARTTSKPKKAALPRKTVNRTDIIELPNKPAPDRTDRMYSRRTGPSIDYAVERQDQANVTRVSVDTVAWMIVFGDAVLNVIDGLSIGAAFERNILAGISISVAVMLEEVTHRLGTFAVLIRAGMSMQQSLLCTFLSACALFPGLIVGILLSDATEDATPYIFCAAGGIFLYMVSTKLNNSI